MNLLAIQETWVWSQGLKDPLEKKMATHFSIVAWEIPWTEESGRWQSMGLQKVGQDSATKQQQQEITESYILKSLVVKLINLLRLFRLIFYMVKTKKNSFFSFCLSFLLVVILFIILALFYSSDCYKHWFSYELAFGSTKQS